MLDMLQQCLITLLHCVFFVLHNILYKCKKCYVCLCLCAITGARNCKDWRLLVKECMTEIAKKNMVWKKMDLKLASVIG